MEKNREINGFGFVKVNLGPDFMASAVFGLVNIQEYNVFNCTLQFYLNFTCIYSRLTQCVVLISVCVDLCVYLRQKLDAEALLACVFGALPRRASNCSVAKPSTEFGVYDRRIAEISSQSSDPPPTEYSKTYSISSCSVDFSRPNGTGHSVITRF